MRKRTTNKRLLCCDGILPPVTEQMEHYRQVIGHSVSRKYAKHIAYVNRHKKI